MSEAQTKSERYAIAANEFRDELVKQVQGTVFEDSQAYRICLQVIKPPFKFCYHHDNALQSVVVVMAWASVTDRKSLKESAKTLKGILDWR